MTETELKRLIAGFAASAFSLAAGEVRDGSVMGGSGLRLRPPSYRAGAPGKAGTLRAPREGRRRRHRAPAVSNSTSGRRLTGSASSAARGTG